MVKFVKEIQPESWSLTKLPQEPRQLHRHPARGTGDAHCRRIRELASDEQRNWSNGPWSIRMDLLNQLVGFVTSLSVERASEMLLLVLF